MNKNKIIFGILGVILLGFVTYLVLNLANSNSRPATYSAGNLTIWLLEDDENSFSEISQEFKATYPQYSSKTIKVESFDDEYTYNLALTNAFIQGTAPDIFMLSNTEESVLEYAARTIDPNRISPNDFRLNYKPVFSEDLIISDDTDASQEYIIGIPFGYETLGVIYNRKYFTRPSELETWSSLVSSINALTEKSTAVVPVGLGNASSVGRYDQIISALLALEGAKGIKTTGSNEVKQVLSFYKAFGERTGDNRYDILSAPLGRDNDIEFFAQGDIAAILGFPRDIMKIDEIGYQSSFLYASPLPSYAGTPKTQAINYRYMVVNKDSQNSQFAQDFLVYLSSEEGQSKISEVYPYYLPAHIAVETDLLERKIYPDFNIVYKNFVSDDTQFMSFNVGDNILYREKLYDILEMDSGYENAFTKAQGYIICSSNKSSSLLNLSSPCNK